MSMIVLTGKDKEFQIWWEWPDDDPDRFPAKVYLVLTKERGAGGLRIAQTKTLIGQTPSPKDIELCNYLNLRVEMYESTYDWKEFFQAEAQITLFALRKIAQTGLPCSQSITVANDALEEVRRINDHFNEHGNVRDFKIKDDYVG